MEIKKYPLELRPVQWLL